MNKIIRGEYRFANSRESGDWESMTIDLFHFTGFERNIEGDKDFIGLQIIRSGRDISFNVYQTSGSDMLFRVDAYYITEEQVESVHECLSGDIIEFPIPDNRRIMLFWKKK